MDKVMRLNEILKALALIVFFLCPTATSAAGFDCTQAVSQVEIMICDTPELNQLDDDLDSLYKLTKAHPNKAQLLQQLRGWLQGRNACEHEQCLLREYQQFVPVFAELVLAPLEAQPLSNTEPIRPNSDNAQAVRRDKTESGLSGRNVGAFESGHTGKMTTVAFGNHKTSSVFELTNDQVVQLLILSAWLSVFALILMVVLGLTGKVVIFYDIADAWWSISPLVFLIGGVIIAITLAPKDAEHGSAVLAQATLVLAGMGALVGIFLTFSNAIKYNRSVALGLLIGLGKAFISVFMAITFIGSFSGAISSKNSSRQAIGPTIILAIVGFLWISLVNGREVHEAKGWD